MSCQVKPPGVIDRVILLSIAATSIVVTENEGKLQFSYIPAMPHDE